MQYKGLRNAARQKVALVAAIAVAGVAAAETGDLDPAFADHGRLSPIPDAVGTARSIDLLNDNGFVVGGGDFELKIINRWEQPRPTCLRSIANFAMLLGEDGAVGSAFGSAALAAIETLGIARQADGSIVAVGHEVSGSSPNCFFPRTLVVFRFNSDGFLDNAFGNLGVFRLKAEHSSAGSSVIVEPDGRIVVAGTAFFPVGESSDSKLIVLRLLANGALDPTFGKEGVFIGSDAAFSHEVRLLRTGIGSYRAVATGLESCIVLGVSADGELDTTFSSGGGRRVLSEQGNPISCESADLGTAGSLLLAGSEISAGDEGAEERRGFVQRLLADGARDPAFAPDEAIAKSMTEVSSIVSGIDGTVLVAGSGEDRGSILRLLASGARDPAFGEGGRTWIDLPSDFGGVPIVHDMAVRVDGSVIAAGGDGAPFVVRLVGTAGGVSPGVLAFPTGDTEVGETSQALVRVRRTGGSDGAVSVAYRTVADGEAVGGEDFTPASGTLQWPDGDTSEREIAIEVLGDDGPPEVFEAFTVALEDAQGGAGLGKSHLTAFIQPDGAPAGQIEFGSPDQDASEDGVGQFWVDRRYYFEGRVCVTVTPITGTAIASADFDADASTVCWDDQEADSQLVEVPIVNDDDVEDLENFALELSNPSGGAIIGLQDTVTISLYDNDVVVTPPPPPPPRGGGGPAGGVELLLLALLTASRRREGYRWRT